MSSKVDEFQPTPVDSATY